ncbi:MAG TPA: hypothetical protein VK558_12285 [Patescibacteria group bacterium]|nr:hypothetical protein [Patescibacteria group bacterium]
MRDAIEDEDLETAILIDACADARDMIADQAREIDTLRDQLRVSITLAGRLSQELGQAQAEADRLREALETARDFVIRERDDLLESLCIHDPDTHEPRRETLIGLDLEAVEFIEADLAVIEAALGHGATAGERG